MIQLPPGRRFSEEEEEEYRRETAEWLARIFHEKPRRPPPTNCPPEGVKVYIIVGGPFVKIGIARNPMVRLRELQAGNPYPLRLHFTKTFKDKASAFAVEQKAHFLLVKCRLKGEWFQCEADVAEAAIVGIV